MKPWDFTEIRLCFGHMRIHAWYYTSDQSIMAGKVTGNRQKGLLLLSGWTVMSSCLLNISIYSLRVMPLSPYSKQLGSAVGGGERRLLAGHSAENKRWKSTQLSTGQLHPPQRLGNIMEKRQNECIAGRWEAGLSSGRDPVTDIMNSQQLWLPILGLHKGGLVNSLTWSGKGLVEPYSCLLNYWLMLDWGAGGGGGRR